MQINPLIQLEDALDSLEHTRKCITESLVEGKNCICGMEDIRAAIGKFKSNVWQENKSG